MKYWYGLLLLVIAIGGIVAWWLKKPEAEDARFRVVTTFHPLTLLTKPIVGNLARVDQIIPSGQEVHNYQPTPANLAELKAADLLIINGANLETEWLESLLESVERSDLPILELESVLSQSIQLLEGEEEGVVGTDPHLWVSPKNATLIATAILEALSDNDPNHAINYQENADQLLAQLKSLDQEITQAVAQFSQKKFIAFHSAFQYFARDYGLEQVAVIEATPGETPTPGTIAEIRSIVESNQLKGLFTEPQFSPALVEQLAQDLGIKIAELDPLETGNENESYVEGMRRNLASLKSILH
ncbi:zinc ABC transporter substrate-binding protein [Candidatus Berkelbacteria bacterium]|nr:zinc ABC transporter substrate-binding protein [Candidatus Berkelbacteria bacterium]